MRNRLPMTMVAIALGFLVARIGDADTYPTESWPSTSTIEALNGTTDSATGLPYIAAGTNALSTPSLRVQFDRRLYRQNLILAQVRELMIVKVATLQIGCYPGHFRIQGTDYAYAGETEVAGADGVAFSDGDDTYYVWIDATNALRMATDATGWPVDVSTFIPLAEVTVASSAITAIEDVRNRVRLATTSAGGAASTGTDEVAFILDQDNGAGAGVDTELRFNRGTTAGDAAWKWDETSDKLVALADRDAVTKGVVEALNFISTVTTGTAPFTVASTTVVTNLNADAVDGISVGTLTEAGGAAYAHSTSELRATAAGDAGDVLVSAGAAAPEWQSLSGAGIQAQDDDLDALADLASTGLLARTAAGTAAERTITAGSSITVTNGDGVGGNPTIAVTGTTENAVQVGTSGGALQSTSVGTDNTVLVGRTGNTPTFRKLLDADIDATAAINPNKLLAGTSAQILVANSSGVFGAATMWGDATMYTGGAVAITPLIPRWTLISKSYSDFATAATTNDILATSWSSGNIYTIHAVLIKHSAAFTGGGASSYTISVGITGTATKYASAFNVFQAPGAAVFEFSDSADAEPGSVELRLFVTSDVNLNLITAGTVQIWVLIGVITPG